MLNIAETNRFGIEIETVGIDHASLARAIHSAIPGSRLSGYALVVMADGRTWKVVNDGSLSGHLNGEIVSPILTHADLDTLQSIVRAVREAGARANYSCGIHIHVDGSRFDGRSIQNLVNIVCKHERLIEKALGIDADRLNRYTKSLDSDFLARLDARRVRSLDDMKAAWYGSAHYRADRYDHTRYHGLNLNSLFYRGTVEFRYFNGSLHAGEVKSYVLLCLALVQRAQTIKASSRARREVDTKDSRWAFRVLLKSLGMVGPDFKVARLHLTKLLEGTSANPARRRRAENPTAPEAPVPTEASAL
jgi:hypothetical protein